MRSALLPLNLSVSLPEDVERVAEAERNFEQPKVRGALREGGGVPPLIFGYPRSSGSRPHELASFRQLSILTHYSLVW